MNWLRTIWKALNEPVTGEGASVETLNNFTPRAQQVLALSRREADRLNHYFVGTEHLLLGLIKLGQGTAVNILRKMGIDLETVGSEIEKQVGTGPDHKMTGNIPYTPRVKKVLMLAAKEAKALNHTYVGTEHILLGLLREGDGVAARVLRNLEVDIEQTRQEILRELNPNFSVSDNESPSVPIKESTATAQIAGPTDLKSDSIDTSKRYDVYCTERGLEMVVYRNALFKSTKKLFQQHQYDAFSAFIELEQANGQTILLARTSIIKFCDPGTTPGAENVLGKQP